MLCSNWLSVCAFLHFYFIVALTPDSWQCKKNANAWSIMFFCSFWACFCFVF